MSRTTLQVPLDTTLRNKAEKAAAKVGFSSVQEVVRVFLNKFSTQAIGVGFYDKEVQLSAKAEARYAGMIKDDWLAKNSIKKTKHNENEFFAQVENPNEVFRQAKKNFIIQIIKMNIFTFKHPTEKGVSLRVKTEETGSKVTSYLDLKRKLSEDQKGTQYIRSSMEYSLKIDSVEEGVKIVKELGLIEDKNLVKKRYVFYIGKFLVYLDHYTKPDNSWWIEIENANKEETSKILLELNAKCDGI